jgi:6-phosphogluconolactonase
LGPRHGAFSPDGRFFYVVNGLGGTVSSFAYEADQGKLALRQTLSSLPPNFSGSSYAAEVAVAPDGRHLYASNRDPDGASPGQ